MPMDGAETQNKFYIYNFYLFLVSCFVFSFYGLGFFEEFFLVDDYSLAYPPQLRAAFDWEQIKSIFTLGYQIDYYPIRDLSYWFDIHILKGVPTEGAPFRFHNLALLYLAAFLVYKILCQIRVDKRVAALAAWTWLLHPYHAEIFMWIGARKDILSLVFSLTLIFSLIRINQEKNHSKRWIALAILSFILGAFSKAGYLLIPLGLSAMILVFPLKELALNRRTKWVLHTLSLVSIPIILFQSNFYRQYNNMFFDYEISYRFFAALAAAGKSLAGWFYPPINTVDIENWGEWLSFNTQYVPIGILFFFSLLFMAVTAVIKKQTPRILALVLIFCLLVSIPGINPNHRNFYSVRYYEFPFLILFALAIYEAHIRFKLRSLQIFLTACLGYFVIFTVLESKNWESSWHILDKTSRSYAGKNPSVEMQKLITEVSLKRWGKLGPEKLATLPTRSMALYHDCTREIYFNPIPRNSTLCGQVWGGFGMNYYLFGIELSEQQTGELIEKSFEMKRQIQKIEFGVLEIKKNREVYILPNKNQVHITELMRFLNILSLCKLDQSEALKLYQDYKKKHLLDKKTLSVVGDSLVLEVKKNKCID